MKKFIYDSYCEAVALSTAPDELKRALKTHERTPTFLANIEREFGKMNRKLLTPITMKNVVYDLTNLYIRNVMRMANEKAMSLVEKARIQAENDRLQKFKSDTDKMMKTGIITEDMLED